MQAFRVVTLACALAGTFAVPGCATNPQPAPRVYTGDGEAAPYPEQWEGQLGAYGDWRTVPRYGRVWYPYVGAGWRPYMYGSWAWGPSGWVWYSDEPWGFTFHYGRWAYAPVGWVWVPGTVWAPAWVNFYWGSGFVGWAPIGYYGAVPWSYWTWVHDHDFGCPRIHTAVHHGHHPHHGGRHGPPPREHITRVSHYPVVRVSERNLPHRKFTSQPIRAARPGGDGRTPSRGGRQFTPTPSRPDVRTPDGRTPAQQPGRGGYGRAPDGTRQPTAPPRGFDERSYGSRGFENRGIETTPSAPRGYDTRVPRGSERSQGGFDRSPAPPRVMQPQAPMGEPPQGQRPSGMGRYPSGGRYDVPGTVAPSAPSRPNAGGGFRPAPAPAAPAPSAPAPSAPSQMPSSPRGGGWSSGGSPFGGSGAPGGGFLNQPGGGSRGFTGGGPGSGSGRGGRSQGMR